MGKQVALCPEGEHYLSSRVFEKKQETGGHNSGGGEGRRGRSEQRREPGHAWEPEHGAGDWGKGK